MDTKDLRGLMEAYSEVYAPQEVDEAVKGVSPHAMQMRKDAAAERRGGDRPLSPSAGKANAAKMQRDIKFYDKITKKTKPSVVGMTHEEVEQVDESGLSADTIRSAIKKGNKRTDDLVAAGNVAGAQRSMSKVDRSKGALAKRRNSVAGTPHFSHGSTSYNEEFDIFDVVLEFLQVEGFAETLEEAEWLMANVIDEEAIDIILGEGIDMKTFKANRQKAQRSAASADAKKRGHVDKFTGKTYSTAEASSRRKGIHTPEKKPSRDAARDAAGGETGHGGALRANKVRKAKAMGELGEDYVNEAQAARENPEKYEREQSKKYAPVRGERTPMPPRGDKRREDFEKWYAANVR